MPRFNSVAFISPFAHLHDRLAGMPTSKPAHYSKKPTEDQPVVTEETGKGCLNDVTFTEKQSDALLALYNELDDEQKSILGHMENAPFGDVVASGCPGSGKTRACNVLAVIACYDRINI